MAKGILNHRPTSDYEDRLPREYHFRKKHYDEIAKCYEDFVIFYEPENKGGRNGYFAVARIVKLRSFDEKGPGHFFAILEHYCDFPKFVPRTVNGQHFEAQAVSATGKFVAQSSVRFPSEDDFRRILEAGGLNAQHLIAQQQLVAV